MPSSIARDLEIIWSEKDIDTVLKAQVRLRSIATKDDLPELVDALRSDRNDFWTRELISEPIAYFGGVDYLPELFDAMAKNALEGHDNDTLAHLVSEIASEFPLECAAKLKALLEAPDYEHRKYAGWLLEFCK